jgi:hypothetical protein
VTWHETLDNLSWRVDVRALSKADNAALDEPVAFFEVASTQGSGARAPRSAKFEMDAEEVGAMLGALGDIQKVFDSAL